MYRVLTIVATIAVIALATSIITAVVQRSTSVRQSREISSLNHQQATDRKAISGLQQKLHAKRSKHHLRPHHSSSTSANTVRPQPHSALADGGTGPGARIGSASIVEPSSRIQAPNGIQQNPAIGPAALPYSGLTWRHALLLN
jgi:hypothetical protein